MRKPPYPKRGTWTPRHEEWTDSDSDMRKVPLAFQDLIKELGRIDPSHVVAFRVCVWTDHKKDSK